MSSKIKAFGGLMLALVVLGVLPVVQAAERVALVMGNSRYDHAPTLNNPENDARAVASALTALGFQVTGPLLNQSKAEMDNALRQFGRQARGAEATVVYFSGHGVEVGGKNYLLPKDVTLERESDASLEAVALDVVLDQISAARGYRLVILDACRDNPLANNMTRANGSKTVYRGLAPIEPGGQTYVAYAARAGQRSQDGAASGNSPYTTALLKFLPQSGLPLERLFGAVRDEVKQTTHDAQTPFLYGEFGAEPVYLNSSVAPQETVDYDLIVWQSADKCGTAACLLAYLGDYPNGRYAGMARARLKPVPESQPSTAVKPPEKPRQSFEPEMVLIKAGCFHMGSPESEARRNSDEKQHQACIKDFMLGRQEVTVGEFKRFVEATGYRTDAEKNTAKEGCFVNYREGNVWEGGYQTGYSWKNPNFAQNDHHPVVCVSWNDVIAYIEWLSTETRQSYRLPTEAEWEYAARAGIVTAQYWGEKLDMVCRYENVADQTEDQIFQEGSVYKCTDGYVYTAPVGSFKENPWGLKDMLGNVSEWTCSSYDQEYSGSEQECSEKDTAKYIAKRGGAWNNSPKGRSVRSAYRSRTAILSRGNMEGFRLARSL